MFGRAHGCFHFVFLLNEIFMTPNVPTYCVIFGNDTVKNTQLFNSMYRMPGHKILIGSETPEVQKFLASGIQLEILATGSNPPSGENVIILDGRL
jgi:hypothetical protein